MGHFLRFYRLNDPENKNLEKMKKIPGDITTLYTFFWIIFSLFTTLTTWKIIMMIKCYTVPEIWCVTHVVFIFHFSFFALLLPPPLSNLKSQNKIKKHEKKKTPGDIIILHMCTKNYNDVIYCSPDMVRDRRIDRQKDRQKKWHIEVGAPPKH